MASDNGHHAGGAAKGDELTKFEERRAHVAHLLTSHHTYREMAQQLGVSHSTIGEDVKVIRERWRERACKDSVRPQALRHGRRGNGKPAAYPASTPTREQRPEHVAASTSQQLTNHHPLQR
jgi:hypothetical protein